MSDNIDSLKTVSGRVGGNRTKRKLPQQPLGNKQPKRFPWPCRVTKNTCEGLPMSQNSISEATVEDAAIAWFEELGYSVLNLKQA